MGGDNMEFKINKIDTDLRQKINEERSEDRIHNKKGININKDKNKNTEKNKKNEEQKEEESEEKFKAADNAKGDSKKEDPYKGNYIDIRR
jgi:hypothetical protein